MSKTKPRRIVILGCGPTALGAAHRLQHYISDQSQGDANLSVKIVEKEHVPGGLARSIRDEHGFTWDLGVHVTGASKFPEFLEIINEAINDWNEVPRYVMANLGHVMQASEHENYVPYPVQDSVPYLPSPLKEQCAQELEEIAHRSNSLGPPKNFADFTLTTFGPSIQNIFIRPYNEKVWTVKLEDLSTVWVEGRVPSVKTHNLRERCAMTRAELDEAQQKTNASFFRYPSGPGGIGELWKSVANRLPQDWFLYGKAVTRIDTERKKVFLNGNPDESIDYDVLISTIPIVELTRMASLLPELSLNYSKVVLVGLGLRRPQSDFCSQMSWLYFPTASTVFYRCTFISNFSEFVTPDADQFWSVMCEIGVTRDAKVDGDDLIERTINGLIEHSILDSPDQVIARWLHVLPFGYPIPTLDRDDQLSRAHKVLEGCDIYSRGRFGGWRYETANQDHSWVMGREVVDRILTDRPETVYRTS